jgi:pimeloyl-ACP methyl ester carboxylesterase
MRLDVPAADLAELRTRLRNTRWATPWPDEPDAGVTPRRLRPLVAHWADGYDWPRHQAELAALPSHFADLDGTPLHYLRFDGGGPPVVLTHGWPSSVLELAGLARRLAGRGHTVIVPSLPGFGLSPQRPHLPPGAPTHELWHRLMHHELGFARYAAHGGDLGAGISARLAEAHPEAVAGIHVLAVAGPRDPVDPADLRPEETAYLTEVAAWTEREGAYQHQQQTRPLTLAHGLADSPAGLLAWLLEKYDTWTDRPFPDDFVLTQASLYWFTGSISTSLRPYFEYARGMTGHLGRVGVPTAVALFPADLTHPPRSWAERTYAVTRWTEMPRGGHFAAYEEPELLAGDVAAFLAEIF